MIDLLHHLEQVPIRAGTYQGRSLSGQELSRGWSTISGILKDSQVCNLQFSSGLIERLVWSLVLEVNSVVHSVYRCYRLVFLLWGTPQQPMGGHQASWAPAWHILTWETNHFYKSPTCTDCSKTTFKVVSVQNTVNSCIIVYYWFFYFLYEQLTVNLLCIIPLYVVF